MKTKGFAWFMTLVVGIVFLSPQSAIAAPRPKTVVGAISITGLPTIGNTLQVEVTGGTPQATYTYQWLRKGKAIPGAVARDFVIPSGYSASDKVQVKVTSTAAGYTTNSASSIAVNIGKFTMVSQPRIVGLLNNRQTIQADCGIWIPAPVSCDVEWFMFEFEPPFSYSTNREVYLQDYFADIEFGFTAKLSSPGIADFTAKSKMVNVLGVFNQVSPGYVSGDAVVGEILTATPPVLDPVATSFKYQWYRGNAKISGATKATYRLTSADYGKFVKVQVTSTYRNYVDRATLSPAGLTRKYTERSTNWLPATSFYVGCQGLDFFECAESSIPKSRSIQLYSGRTARAYAHGNFSSPLSNVPIANSSWRAECSVYFGFGVSSSSIMIQNSADFLDSEGSMVGFTKNGTISTPWSASGLNRSQVHWGIHNSQSGSLYVSACRVITRTLS